MNLYRLYFLIFIGVINLNVGGIELFLNDLVHHNVEFILTELISHDIVHNGLLLLQA